jgi:polysaccharide biosynthesis protein PslH
MTVLNYSTEEMKGKLRSLLQQTEFDAIQLESIHLAAYIDVIKRYAPGANLIMDWHNIESELMERHARGASSLVRRAVAHRTARQLLHMESDALRSIDLLLLTSARELELVQGSPWRARCPLVVVENGVACADFAQIKTGERIETRASRSQLIFVGSMDYHANIDAVIWFAREVWHLVHAAFPAMTFRIIGRRPTDAVNRLARIPGVEVIGEVNDVRPFYSTALAAVVPLRTGGGTRLKILEAMAAGVPVISTRLGAEGLAVEHDRDLLIADAPTEIAEAVRCIATDVDLGERLASHAHRVVRDRYDWSAVGNRLRKAYAELPAVKTSQAVDLAGRTG